MRIIPIAACALALLSTAAQAGYTEVWNPPEARSPVGAHTTPTVPRTPLKTQHVTSTHAQTRHVTSARPQPHKARPIPRSVYAPARTVKPLKTRQQEVSAPPPATEASDAVPVLRTKDLPPLQAPDGSILRT